MSDFTADVVLESALSTIAERLAEAESDAAYLVEVIKDFPDNHYFVGRLSGAEARVTELTYLRTILSA